MRLLSSFIPSERGSATEKFAFGALLVAVASLTSVNLLTKMASVPLAIQTAKAPGTDDKYASMGSLGPVEQQHPSFNNVDKAPTATVSLGNARAVVLDPCTGKSK